MSFADWVVVHPACGVVMKLSKNERAVLPKRMLSLKHRWDVAVSAGTACKLDASCDHCKKGVEGGGVLPSWMVVGGDDGDDRGDDAEATTTCPLCLHTFHESCSIILEREHQSQIRGVLLCAELGWLPDQFKPHLCKLCKSGLTM
jgi:hypothetical protein